MLTNILIFGFLLPFKPKPYYKQALLKKQIYIMKFEEIDGDYNSDGNLINNSAINNETFPQDINFNMEKELNESVDESNFPSFYKFVREREIKEINEKKQYLTKAKINAFNITKAINESKANYLNEENKKIKIERYEDFEPTSKDLKILSSFSSIEWTRTWMYEMLHVPDYFPTFMFQDMFLLRDFGQKNNSKNYFYIGYYPSDINLKNGPFYIGAFELVPKMREFRTHIIVQNPYYCVENIYDENKIKNFKKELMAMCNDATVFFKFSNLQNTSEQRYYYSWLYEE
jgi:hypothetical protein